ncbi:hypothetical protein ACTXT7_004678 [Hymenolepis weldensis]
MVKCEVANCTLMFVENKAVFALSTGSSFLRRNDQQGHQVLNFRLPFREIRNPDSHGPNLPILSPNNVPARMEQHNKLRNLVLSLTFLCIDPFLSKFQINMV